MNEEIKDLEYWKKNCEENYITTPISVLKYITELEKANEKASNAEIIGSVSNNEVSVCCETCEYGGKCDVRKIMDCTMNDDKHWKQKK